MMAFEKLLKLSQDLLDKGNLEMEEETVPEKSWGSQGKVYLNGCLQFLEEFKEHGAELNPPPVQTLLVLGGLCGNTLTTGALRITENLHEVAIRALEVVVRNCGVDGVRKLLLLKPKNLSQPNSPTLAIQFLRLCVARIARSSGDGPDDSLSKCPVFRDALVWLTGELGYPELADEEFIGVLQPLGLRLTRDYRPQLQLAGFRVIRHLATKARVADWRQSNRAEAVISQVFDHRVASTPGSSEAVLDEMYATLMDLIQLLEPSKKQFWYDKIADQLLFDFSMESRKIRQTVLVRHLDKIMDVMKSSFVGHTRRFLHLVELILLGPSTPSYLKESLPNEALDSTVHLAMLQCVEKFLQLAWPLVCSTLLPALVPPLIAFVDLEHTAASQADDHNSSLDERISEKLSSIFRRIIELQPRALQEIFIPASATVPSLSIYLPAR